MRTHTRVEPIADRMRADESYPEAGLPHSELLTPDFLNSRLLEETICQAAWAMAVSASFQLDIQHGVRDYSFWR